MDSRQHLVSVLHLAHKEGIVQDASHRSYRKVSGSSYEIAILIGEFLGVSSAESLLIQPRSQLRVWGSAGGTPAE